MHACIECRQIWFEYFLMVQKYNSIVRNSISLLIRFQSRGGYQFLSYPAPIGAYGLDASITIKFGFNASLWCGNRIPQSEAHIFSLFPFGGRGWNLVTGAVPLQVLGCTKKSRISPIFPIPSHYTGLTTTKTHAKYFLDRTIAYGLTVAIYILNY